jgi:hypothetical protein
MWNVILLGTVSPEVRLGMLWATFRCCRGLLEAIENICKALCMETLYAWPPNLMGIVTGRET